jgi:ABC-type transport system involved in multi-copper enzyme maturation permease subunit
LTVKPVAVNPVLSREIRVLSRRRHLYLARSGYLLFLAAVLWVQWSLTVRQAQLAEVAGANWMNMVSRFVTGQIMWFQFLGLQLLAVILLSGSLGEEIQHRRLDVLRCTPLPHRRIVSGKLVSRMLLLLFWLGLSLPGFSVLRAWGGISAVYLMHAGAVTALTCLFAAALSAWLSVYWINPVQVVSGALAVLAAWYSIQIAGVFSTAAQAVLWTTNPYWVMAALGRHLTHPDPNETPLAQLPVFYAAMSGATVLLFLLAVGGLYTQRDRAVPIPRRRSRGIVRRRGLRLVAWLDLRGGRRFWLHHLLTVLVVGLPLVVLFVVGSRYQWRQGILRVRELCITALYFVILVRTVTSVAYSVGREKEGRSWTGLLMTPLSSRQILHGKAWAALAANASGWLLLLAALIVFGWVMSQVGRFMMSGLHRIRLVLAICQMGGYLSFAVGVSLLWAVVLRNSLQALVSSLLCLGLAYGLYRFGLQPAFAWWGLPWLSQHGPSWGHVTYIFAFAFGVAGLQGLAGVVCLVWAQCRLRPLS